MPLAVVAIALIGAVGLIYVTISAERAERAQVRLTNQIMLELRNVGRAALNAETGQRGYFITLDRRYLEPYQVGKEQFEPALARLRSSLQPVATERQSELLDDIERLARRKFTELDETVALVEQRELVEAQQRILSNEGQEAMARLRLAIGELEDIEAEILADASAQAAAAEARVLPMIALLLVMLLGALALGYFQVTRTAAAEAAAANADKLAAARDRADLLARELNHRVKNLFAVVLAIVRLSSRDTPEAKPVVDSIADRITALLKAHEVSQGTLEAPVADLRALIDTTLAPYRGDAREAVVEGPSVQLAGGQITPLGLVLHELTTNAVKYGAWSGPGTINVDWSMSEIAKGKQLIIEWNELSDRRIGEPHETGFGSKLMTSSARQLGGTIAQEFREHGVRVLIELPLAIETESG